MVKLIMVEVSCPEGSISAACQLLVRDRLKLVNKCLVCSDFLLVSPTLGGHFTGMDFL